MVVWMLTTGALEFFAIEMKVSERTLLAKLSLELEPVIRNIFIMAT
jgi:hypothetical protein